jgi:hypothetical protein
MTCLLCVVWAICTSVCILKSKLYRQTHRLWVVHALQPFVWLSFCRNTLAKPRDGLPCCLRPLSFSEVEKTREEALYDVVLPQRRLPRIPRAGRAGALQNRSSSVLAAGRCALLGCATPLRLAGRADAVACSWFAGLLRAGGSGGDQVEREDKLFACS